MSYSAIVAHMDTSNVDTVLVAGKVMKRAGKLVGVDIKHIGEARRLVSEINSPSTKK